MNISGIIQRGSLATLTVAVSLHSWGAAPFDASAQPLGSVAPLVLSDSNLAHGVTKAYRPWFENGSWQGDIIEYTVASNGAASTSIQFTGSSPSNSGGEANWSALVQLAANEAADADVDYWDTGRKIITLNGTQKAFRFATGDIGAANMALVDPTAATAGDPSSKILNFIRGDGSNEYPATAALRNRTSVLGDIIHSNPVYVAAPTGSRTDDDYAAWATHTDRLDRAARIYVGANDGMLHVFDALTGNEVYAYIPSMLMSNLATLTARPYTHQYFVDGKLTVADAFFDSDSKWHTVLAGSLGAGGQGIFAMDITNPDLTDEDSATGTNRKILWERTPADDTDIGDSFSRPVIAKLNNGKWYVIVGNGFNSATGKAKLLIFDIDDGSLDYQLDTDGLGDASDPNGLSSPTLLDTDNNGTADFVYAGDINGNLWKFNLSSIAPSDWGNASNVVKLHAGVTVAGVPTQPITVAPTLVLHPVRGYVVHFATGKLYTEEDITDTSVQAIYGIWDNLGNPPNTPVLISQVVALPKTYSYTEIIDETVETFEEIIGIYDPDDTIDWATDHGWKIELVPTGGTGGLRVLEPIQVRAGRVKASVHNPNDALNRSNWLLEASILDGGPHPTPIFDLNSDQLLTPEDRYQESSTWHIPMLWQEFDGIMSQVTIARVSNGIDTQFRNLLTPPIITNECTEDCTAGFQGGHIDVDTWHDTSATFAGGSTQHDHEYDKKVGRVYVDMFDINVPEPAEPATADIKTVSDHIEINADGSDGDSPASGIASDTEFVILIANADFSPGSIFKIGAKEWNVLEYQRQIHQALKEWDATDASDFPADTDGDSMIYTWGDIMALPDAEDRTIRHSFSDRSILDGGLHPTQTGCVRDSAFGGDKDGPITLNPFTGVGRWRNGALTTQLIRADHFTANPAISQVVIQKPIDLVPEITTSSGQTITTSIDFNANGTIEVLNHEVIAGLYAATGTEHMWESTLFWHFGELSKLVYGTKPCYGDDDWEQAVLLEQSSDPITAVLEKLARDFGEIGAEEDLPEDFDIDDFIDRLIVEGCADKGAVCAGTLKAAEKIKKFIEGGDYDNSGSPGSGGGNPDPDPTTDISTTVGGIGSGCDAQDSDCPTLFGGPDFDYGRMTWTDVIK